MAVNVIFELGTNAEYLSCSPATPYTITDNDNHTFTITATQGTFVRKSYYGSWFDDSGVDGSTGLSASLSSDQKTFTLTFKIFGDKTGTVYLNPEMNLPLSVDVVKNLTNCTTPQTFTNIDSAGQYTIQVFPSNGYFFLDNDTINNYQTLSDSTVGSLDAVNFNKSGSTVTNVEFVYTAPTSGVAVWTIYAKTYPTNGKRIDCYNDGTFTTNIISGAKYLNETVRVILKAVDGKYFSVTPTYDYNNISGTHNFTKVDDTEYYADISFPETIDGNTYTSVNVYAAAVLDVKSYFTYDLTNCTISPEIEDTRYSRIFILSPNSGYKFENPPTVTGATQVTIATMTTGDYRISYTFNPNENVTISATAVIDQIEPEKLNLSYSLTNVSTNVPAQEITENQKLTITLTANNKATADSYKYDELNQYYFTTTPYYSMDGKLTDFVKVDELTYTANITVTGDITVTASATGTATLIRYVLQNCTGTPKIWKNSDENITVTVTADTGYVFETSNTPTFSYYTGDESYMTKVSNSVYIVNLPEDGGDYSEEPHGKTQIYATAVIYTPPPPPIDPTVNHGFINIYRPTQDQLASLSKYRFNRQSSSTEYDDAGQYIYRLHKVFFNVPSSRDSAIQLAYHQTQVVAPAVDSEIISADCGTITVTEEYHNSFDYDGYTRAKIYLPFVGFRDIDVNNVMNDTVSLQYKLNVLNAECVAIISTSKRNEIETYEGVAGFDIPYMLNFYRNGINSSFANSGVYMSGFTPYLQLFTKKPYLADGSPYGYKTNSWVRLSSLQGYAEFEDVNLQLIHNNITQSELTQIRNLLIQGVFL